MQIDGAVKERYSKAAQEREAALCCPVDYDPQFLKAIPSEVIERDYGCGDPSKHLKPGETVLDLGSGTGKICFIASQVVGENGKVIGVDINDDMLGIAENARSVVADKIGFDNVEFRKGKIQDLKLNRELVANYLKDNPVSDHESLMKMEAFVEESKKSKPLVADNSVDVVVSNCVLNLVGSEEKEEMFREIFRVLKRGGRAVISDIVSDEFVPRHMQEDEHLWSGCISGAFQERDFLQAFERAGFYGVEVLKMDDQPWQTVEGIEFRSMTVQAYKGKEGECWDHNEAVIYEGPFSKVQDDDGHTFYRGMRTAVCRKTYDILSKEPYGEFFHRVPPHKNVEKPKPFTCKGVEERRPSETKGEGFDLTTTAPDATSCC